MLPAITSSFVDILPTIYAWLRTLLHHLGPTQDMDTIEGLGTLGFCLRMLFRSSQCRAAIQICAPPDFIKVVLNCWLNLCQSGAFARTAPDVLEEYLRALGTGIDPHQQGGVHTDVEDRVTLLFKVELERRSKEIADGIIKVMLGDGGVRLDDARPRTMNLRIDIHRLVESMVYHPEVRKALCARNIVELYCAYMKRAACWETSPDADTLNELTTWVRWWGDVILGLLHGQAAMTAALDAGIIASILQLVACLGEPAFTARVQQRFPGMEQIDVIVKTNGVLRRLLPYAALPSMRASFGKAVESASGIRGVDISKQRDLFATYNAIRQAYENTEAFMKSDPSAGKGCSNKKVALTSLRNSSRITNYV